MRKIAKLMCFRCFSTPPSLQYTASPAKLSNQPHLDLFPLNHPKLVYSLNKETEVYKQIGTFYNIALCSFG